MSWMLIIALVQPSTGQYVDKIVVGPFPSESVCKMARVEGMDQLVPQRLCVSMNHWEGRTSKGGK
jgi:hypothetical protein